ncbi:cyclin-like protein [Pyronema omphalodes]|nr:cyclin-like protein [Pyronema omphalodes]
MPSSCPACGCSNPADFDDSTGNVVCTQCGYVINDSHIVSEIAFGENSAGAATVQGSFVSAGQTHAIGSSRFRTGGLVEAREQTVQEARRRLVQLAAVLNCPDHFVEQAQRYYTLALTNNFTKGRKSQYVVACALYISCRVNKSSHMLIDFSDILHINVFTLGQTYLKLIACLKIKLPNIDPTIYVHRFAKHLEFGTDVIKVAKDALRLIQRMNRDWIVAGRRPSGICGAALILAARMNNFRRSVREVVYVVKVADLTIHKRLQEFKETQSGDLTIEEFRNIWLEQTHDPPSFNPKKKRKRVRKVNDDGEVTDEWVTNDEEAAAPAKVPAVEPKRDADGFVIPSVPIDPSLIDPALTGSKPADANQPLPTPPATNPNSSTPGTPGSEFPEDLSRLLIPDEATNAIADSAIAAEISSLVDNPDTLAVMEELRRATALAVASVPESTVSNDPDNLNDVDDDWEVQAAVLDDQEAEMKKKIWTEFNKEWLREQEMKRLKAVMDARLGIVKTARKRGKKRPRDSTSENMASSPAESAKEMLKRRAYSKKINYKAIEGLFED